jgi:hypothetical protein
MMPLSSYLEDALLAVSESRDVDPTNTALVSACYELEGLGYIDLVEKRESMTHEQRLYKMTVTHITLDGEEELAEIKVRRGI